MSVVLKVENLSKRYLLNHRESQSLNSIREIVSAKAGSIFKKKSAEDRSSTEEFWALKDVNFEIQKGDRVGIIGKNGAGKSTLLKILSRITEPTSGKISIKGRIASLLEVGTGFHPELSGRENIYLNGSILGMSRAEITNKFGKIVEFSEVEKFLDTPVKRYSSGMYVRLAFSIAAHLEPEILILDEVLSVGDFEFQKKCMEKVKEISTSEGRTVLFVSHNMGAINALCNNAILLSNGRILGMGNTETVTGIYFSGSLSGIGEFVIGKKSTDEKVIIEKVTLRNSDGKVENNFEFGSNIEVEVELNSLYDFEKPYVWIAIKNARGPISGASGLVDGYRPNTFVKGKNIIKCTFLNVPLLTGQYTIYMGMRENKGIMPITDSKDVAVFNITSVLAKKGLNSEIADTIAADTLSPVIPYRWEFNDGKKYTFNIEDYVKQ